MVGLARASGTRETGAARQAFDALKPFRKGEVAMRQAEWPEMRAFLEGQAAKPPEA